MLRGSESEDQRVDEGEERRVAVDGGQERGHPRVPLDLDRVVDDRRRGSVPEGRDEGCGEEGGVVDAVGLAEVGEDCGEDLRREERKSLGSDCSLSQSTASMGGSRRHTWPLSRHRDLWEVWSEEEIEDARESKRERQHLAKYPLTYSSLFLDYQGHVSK